MFAVTARTDESENLPVVADQASDETLMERVNQGDRDALRVLLERYWRSLVLFGSSMLGAVDDAEDLVQDVFFRVWQHSGWTRSGSVSAYLYRITRNMALNAIRDRCVEARSRERGAPRLARTPNTPHDDLAARSLRRDVETAIAGLPKRRREAFVLARFHGLSHREIADVMGISPQTVANQITAALDDLRSALAHRIDPI